VKGEERERGEKNSLSHLHRFEILRGEKKEGIDRYFFSVKERIWEGGGRGGEGEVPFPTSYHRIHYRPPEEKKRGRSSF